MAALLYDIKTLVAMHPVMAIPVARARGHGEVIARDTEIVIEGFPRTASSFAVVALRQAAGRRVRIAHHVHAPAQVMLAARWRIPALVLIREPEDAILSMVIRNPDVRISQAMRGYARFYRPLLPVRPRFVVATFEEVTSDYGQVIDRVNERFGTSFVRFDHTDVAAASIIREIEREYLTRDAPGEALELAIPRPSERRRQLKDELRGRYRDPAFSKTRAELQDLYRRFLQERSR